MTQKHVFKKISLALIPILFSASVLAGNFGLENAQVQAYSASSLPTTINLNDSSEQTIRNYYSSLNSLETDARQGEALLKYLKPILQNNQKYYKYDNNDALWKIYEISDRDWVKSPATEITYGTYDPSSNTIVDYVYGSNSNKKNNPYVHALYVDRSVDNPKTAWDAHTGRSSAACIEREHIWPKSHGFDAEEVAGARGDPIHLWAADGQTNGIHNNYFYGYVDLDRSYKNTKDDTHPWNGNNYLGFSKTSEGVSGTVFEPQDCDKGDIARACFYMVARYNNIGGSDLTIDSANPNLSLTNDVSLSEETGTSTPTRSYSLGILKDLLEWNKLDPVDEYEIHRNNLLFNNYTNNRNPFIDFPEWADIIWGDLATTTYADPLNDEINKGGTYTPVINPEEPEQPEPQEPEQPKSEPTNGFDYFGFDPIVFYGIVGGAVLVVVIFFVIIIKVGSKAQKKMVKKVVKKGAKKIIKNEKKKRKNENPW